MKQDRREAFNERRQNCSHVTRDVLDFLTTVAEHAGSGSSPTLEVRGIGVTYWRDGKRFCRFDLRPRANHVWALIPGAARTALAPAGTVSDREDGPWVTIKNMRGAV